MPFERWFEATAFRDAVSAGSEWSLSQKYHCKLWSFEGNRSQIWEIWGKSNQDLEEEWGAWGRSGAITRDDKGQWQDDIPPN